MHTYCEKNTKRVIKILLKPFVTMRERENERVQSSRVSGVDNLQ